MSRGRLDPKKYGLESLRGTKALHILKSTGDLQTVRALLGHDDITAGIKALHRLTRPRGRDGKTLKGINFFNPLENALLRALQNPRVNIAGIRRAKMPDASRILGSSNVSVPAVS